MEGFSNAAHFMAQLAGAIGMTEDMMGPWREIFTGYFSSRTPFFVLMRRVSSITVYARGPPGREVPFASFGSGFST